MDLQEHYDAVIRAFLRGRAVPFLGAGANLCGRPHEVPWRHAYLPSGAELSEFLADTLEFPQAAPAAPVAGDPAPRAADIAGDRGELTRVTQYLVLRDGTGPRASFGTSPGEEVFMSEWLEFTLLVLKVVGIIGAFAGLSGEASKRPKRILAFFFLAMAIGAELCDSLLKRIDSREQAVRFERLAHPLGTIQVTPLYALSLGGSLLNKYRARLDAGEELLVPDEHSEPAAYALFTAWPDIDVFLYRAGPEEAARTDGEPDLSFSVPVNRSLLTRPMATEDRKMYETGIARDRHYTYHAGEVHAQISVANSPDDRYSNGSIISTEDLLGAEIKIRFCPLVVAADGAVAAELAQRVRLETLYVAFPGRQEFAITAGDKKVRTVSSSGSNSCSYFYYTLPSNRAEFEKARVP